MDTTLGTGVAGVPSFNILRSQLLSAMVGVLEDVAPGHVRFGCSVRGITSTKGASSVTLESGEVVPARLVVGADGIHSVVRKKVFGDTGIRSDGIVACWGVLPRNTPSTASNASNASNDSNDGSPTNAPAARDPPGGDGAGEGHIALRGSTMLGFVNHSKAFIWYISFPLAEKFVAVPPLEAGETWRAKALAAMQGTPMPELEELVRRTPEDESCVTMCVDRHPMSSFIRGDVVVIGDSAHPFTPFAGQGASQAMVDAVVLAHMLRTHGDDVGGTAIEAYDKMLRKVAIEQTEFSRGLVTSSWLERVGMKYFLRACRWLPNWVLPYLFDSDTKVRPNTLLPLEGDATATYQETLEHVRTVLLASAAQ